MTQKLTLNLGLRWDYRAAAYEEQNHFFWLDTTNPRGGLCYADKTLSNQRRGSGRRFDQRPDLEILRSSAARGSKKPFAPRFGFAYRLTDKTVVRGGYGIFFDSAEGREIDDSGDIYPYSIRNSLSPGTEFHLAKLTNSQFQPYDTLGRSQRRPCRSWR